jgi:hypothetical protein
LQQTHRYSITSSARATSSSADGPFTLHSTLDHLAKDRLDVCLRKRSQRLRPNISKGAAAQSKRSHGNIIRCLNNRNDIQHTVRYTELAPDRFKNFWR